MTYRPSRRVLLLMILAAEVLSCSARRGGRAGDGRKRDPEIRSGAGAAAAGLRLGTRCRASQPLTSALRIAEDEPRRISFEL
jgi:hypothetical protein